MWHPFRSPRSSPPKREENTGTIYEMPWDSANGSFVFPRKWPMDFRETSVINISWTTTYQGANLYYYQRGKAATPIQLAANLATGWYQWEVEAKEADLTEPYVFRIADARGAREQTRTEGFWSTSFYITRDAPASAADPSASPAAATPTAPGAALATPTAPQASRDGAASRAGPSAGAIAGTVLAVILGIVAVVAACVWARRRRRRRAPREADDPPEPPPKPLRPPPPPADRRKLCELYNPQLELQNARPVAYELPSDYYR
ncbi:hypothetical protein GGS23DRAFT_608568 [Durotheca rogersii]|uniref:uncharacterized protein n=1 Tax=Durotheca rogersii TaxID=419775 RepID=UPI00221FFCEF|nr:uncharacterized protein GGS23DRAFT_608568 [Durotheca rogersii]KAI5868012.1 hypothetical protein GGS23DRAFT_608568 [Durotheca rogersii]